MAGRVVIHVATTATAGVCPGCGVYSARVRSRYRRRLRDVPMSSGPRAPRAEIEADPEPRDRQQESIEDTAGAP
ncbi:transposase family protein [Glycomyces rhizosphaerae]|uniref:Transposase family protein n=1 Tax=Glycomyces rhizosphaerae TaxID=2054422 RepID=A0ABV7PUB2_9ACTN